MRNLKALILAYGLFITGCSSSVSQTATQDAIDAYMRPERMAIEKTGTAIEKECGSNDSYMNNGRAGAKSKVYKYYQCATRIRKNMWEPYALYADLYSDYSNRRSKTFSDYKEGKIDFDEYSSELIYLTNAYEGLVSSRIVDRYVTPANNADSSAQTWRGIAAAFSSSAQQYNNQVQQQYYSNQQRARDAILYSPAPVTTNCYNSGGELTCYTR